MAEDFLIVRQSDVAWQDDEGDTDVLSLGRGVRVKVLYQDEEQTDLLVRFPPGYKEPAHTHHGEHHGVVLEGRMLVQGQELGPGDLVIGPRDVMHGPYTYPDGCTGFVTFRGSARHLYDGSPAGGADRQ